MLIVHCPLRQLLVVESDLGPSPRLEITPLVLKMKALLVGTDTGGFRNGGHID